MNYPERCGQLRQFLTEHGKVVRVTENDPTGRHKSGVVALDGSNHTMELWVVT